MRSPLAGMNGPGAGMKSPLAGMSGPGGGMESPLAGMNGPLAGICTSGARVRRHVGGERTPVGGATGSENRRDTRRSRRIAVPGGRTTVRRAPRRPLGPPATGRYRPHHRGRRHEAGLRPRRQDPPLRPSRYPRGVARRSRRQAFTRLHLALGIGLSRMPHIRSTGNARACGSAGGVPSICPASFRRPLGKPSLREN
jgi:hypothetical protein